jgi:hypothetical protein
LSTTITTVTGTASYPHLTQPNTKFDADGTYSVNLRLSDADAKALISQIETAVQADVLAVCARAKVDPAKVKRAPLPWGPAKEVKNTTEFKIKNNRVCGSGDKKFTFTPRLFDALNRVFPADEKIGMGSKIRVAFQPYVWFVKGETGISLRLQAVQVIELKSPASAEAFGFTAVTEIGSVAAPDVAAEQDEPLTGEQFMDKLNDAMKSAAAAAA